MPVPRKPSLGQHLRKARINRGLSVAEVARQVEVTRTAVYFWEAGGGNPRADNLKALCKVLNLPVRATLEMAGR
jgi:transcriptional regulator with XRE-family HTH domain